MENEKIVDTVDALMEKIAQVRKAQEILRRTRRSRLTKFCGGGACGEQPAYSACEDGGSGNGYGDCRRQGY